MAAAVCGTKRSFFEEIPASPPGTKRLRRSSSPPKFTPPSILDQLRAVFPNIDPQLLERALEECNNNLDSAIKKLNEHCVVSAEEKSGFVDESGANVSQGTNTDNGDPSASNNPPLTNKVPVNGAEWVELLVTEMVSATNMDDARGRAARVLEILEKSIVARAGDEAVQSFQQENMKQKEQIEVLIRENSILKRAVAIQHERQKEYEDRNQELQLLKQTVCQYQEKVRTLEVNNYALTMHLQQAQQNSTIPGRFHPDVF